MNSSAQISQSLPPILVLAGGRATRLKNLSIDTPKYLMPVSNKQIFADIHLDWIAKSGFKKVFLSIGHLGEKIKEFCGKGERWNLEVNYIEDGPTLRGTGGAVRNSLEFNYQELCITYGDTLLSFNIQDFVQKFRDFAQSKDGLGAMTVYKNAVPGHICNVDWYAPFITYDKKNPNPNWQYIDYGFMILKRKLIENFPDELPLDLAAPLSQASYEKQLMGYPVQERFWEIGSPEALREFQNREK